MSYIKTAFTSNGTYVAASNIVNFNSRLGLTATSGIVTLDLAATGVSAGTYSSYTVDTFGRVLSGSNLSFSGDVSGTAIGNTVFMSLPAIGTPGTYNNVTVNAKGIITGGTAISYVLASVLGATNGVATLDSTGKVTIGQIPASLVGGLNYQGGWNATTNTPPLVSSTGTKGYYYKVSTAGSTNLDGLTQWNAGDLAAFNGTTWDKIDGISSEVLSVNGSTGAVSITTITGNAGTATALANPQPIALAGDVTGTANFAGNTGATLTVALAASGATAGTFAVSVINAKGLVTTGMALAVTGDATGTSSGSGLALTLASVGTAGTYTVVTTDGKGRVSVGGNLSITGDATGTAVGGAIALTLASVGTAGTYTSVTTDAKGRVTAGANLSATGDATGTASGSSIALTLAAVGTAGTYTAVTTDAKGRVIVGAALSATGDATGTAVGTSVALTLASVGTAGTYTAVTTDAKGRVTAGAALTATGDATGTASGTAIALTLASVGTAGTYRSVVTDSKGRVISGTSPTRQAATGSTGTFTVGGAVSYVGINVTTPSTITLTPSVSTEGRTIFFKDEGGNAYTNNVTISSTELIDGATTTVINVNGEAISLYYSNSAWWLI